MVHWAAQRSTICMFLLVSVCFEFVVSHRLEKHVLKYFCARQDIKANCSICILRLTFLCRGWSRLLPDDKQFPKQCCFLVNSSSISYFSQQMVCMYLYLTLTYHLFLLLLNDREETTIQLTNTHTDKQLDHLTYIGLSQYWSETRNVSATRWHCFPTLLHNLGETACMYVYMYVCACTWFLQCWLLDLSLVLTQINCYYCVLVQAFHSSPIQAKEKEKGQHTY